MKIFIGIMLAIIITLGGFGVASYNGFQDTKNHILMLYQTNQNKLSNYTMIIKEKLQISEKYENTLKEVIRQTMQGRYGDNEETPLFKFIKEQNINIDTKIYLDLMNTINAERKGFALAQDERANACRIYNNKIKSFPSNIVAKVFDFKAEDMETYCTLVSDERTNEIFKTNLQQPMKF